MPYKLTKNDVDWTWHRGTRSIRADILNSGGEKVGSIHGTQSNSYRGGGVEYTICTLPTEAPTDPFVLSLSRQTVGLRKGWLNTWRSRKDLLEDLNEERTT